MGQGQNKGRLKKKQQQRPSATEDVSAGLSSVLLMMDQYPIKLTAEQCAQLYGFLSTKPRILRWSDVIEKGSGITFRKCVDAKVDIAKLYNMQCDLQQWIHYEKVTVDDCGDLAPWRPNPFLDFQCHVGDLIMRKHVLTHAVLVRGGVTFELLWDRFGLTPAVMAMVRYTPEQWIELGLQPKHVEALGDEHWALVFRGRSRKYVLEGIQRHAQSQPSRVKRAEAEEFAQTDEGRLRTLGHQPNKYY